LIDRTREKKARENIHRERDQHGLTVSMDEEAQAAQEWRCSRDAEES
jgi:hypothetical protein